MEIIGLTFDVVGTILIAIMALKVHHNVIKERKIDSEVFEEMKLEQFLGITGVVLLIVGYILQISSKIL